MELGVALPSFSSRNTRIPPRRIKNYARRAEELGFAGGWVLEHIIQPPTYSTSWLDPLSTLAVVGGATESLPLGTSILIFPMRNPVMVAKKAASIQYLTERRLTLGLGIGYIEKEYASVNMSFDDRGERFLEGLGLLTDLFRGETVTFEGGAYELRDVRLEPEVDRPPRLVAGGGSVERDGELYVPEPVKRRVLHADGWISVPYPPERVARDWSEIATFLEDHEVNPASRDKLVLMWTHAVPHVRPQQARAKQFEVFRSLVGEGRDVTHAEENYLLGSMAQMQDQLNRYREQGIDQVILAHPPADPAELDRQLEIWNDFFRPEFP